MNESFVTWLLTEMDVRGWTNSELARRANLVPSTISMVVSQQKRPGLEFCVGVAQAFGLPPEDVLRAAGLIPSIPGPIAEEREMITILRTLPAAIRRTIVTMLRALAGQKPGPAAIGEPTAGYDIDEPLIPELLEEFRQVPDEWKEVAVQQMTQFRRMAELRPVRFVGEEEESETERPPASA